MLLKYPNSLYRQFLKSQTSTRLFKFVNYPHVKNGDLLVVIEFNCKDPYIGDKFYIERYSSLSQKPIDNKIKVHLANFPGCREADKTRALSVKIPADAFSENYELLLIPESKLSLHTLSFKLNAKPISLEYYSYPNDQSTIIASVRSNPLLPLYAYGFDIKEPMIVERSSAEFDLGSIINKLISKKIVKSSVSIWSPVPHTVVTKVVSM